MKMAGAMKTFTGSFNWKGEIFNLTLLSTCKEDAFHRMCFHIAKRAETSVRRVKNFFRNSVHCEIKEG